MTFRILTALSLAFGMTFIVGCGDKAKPSAKELPAKGSTEEHDDHDHGPGPHKGTIGEWGNKHFEFTVDHKKQEATVYILKGNAKDASPIKTDKVTLSIKEPKFQVELKAVPESTDPAGTSSRFVGKDEKFGKEQEFAGTLDAVVEGKPYSGDFAEKPEKK